MSHYPTIAFFCVAVILIFVLFVIKKRNKRRLLLLSTWILFVPLFLPRQWWGHKNAIKAAEGRKIIKIVLSPSTPDWKVNLTDTLFTISDTQEINHIVHLLREADVYFPGHPVRTWETQFILVTADHDSIPFQVDRTANNGTDIYGSDDKWRKDELGPYLEKVVNYQQPVRARNARDPH